MDNNLEIRPATSLDIHAIIQLFGICLRSAGGSPTQEFWHWKHQINPFGISPVLLAFDEHQLIGLRAFLPWQWQYNHQSYQSFRAVDTATHPSWQGRGVFKKLTMQLWRDVQLKNPASFIFNTPNFQSKPGYLKMGWQVLGKPPVCFKYYPGWQGQRSNKYEAALLMMADFNFESVEASLLKYYQPKGIAVKVSAPYLQWRYQQIPDRKYAGWVYQDGKGNACLFIFYLRQRGVFTELRICSSLVLQSVASTEKVLQMGIAKLAKHFAGCVVTYIGSNEQIGVKILNRFVPEVTIKMPDDKLALPTSWTNILNWEFEMGGLELF